MKAIILRACWVNIRAYVRTYARRSFSAFIGRPAGTEIWQGWRRRRHGAGQVVQSKVLCRAGSGNVLHTPTSAILVSRTLSAAPAWRMFPADVHRLATFRTRPDLPCRVSRASSLPEPTHSVKRYLYVGLFDRHQLGDGIIDRPQVRTVRACHPGLRGEKTYEHEG